MYLRNYVFDLMDIQGGGGGMGDSFRYVPDSPKLPRILLLGDSISRGIWTETQNLFGSLANIQGAPTNCHGFDLYNRNLQNWLGGCPRDVIQFNVGMHYGNHNDMQSYKNGLHRIVDRLKSHSPSAMIVIALTTPSPFDSPSTTPDKNTCRNYGKFKKMGDVGKLNDAAKELAKELNVTISDRYSAILPKLGLVQKPCDIHFEKEGYELLARHDWEVISYLLSQQSEKLA